MPWDKEIKPKAALFRLSDPSWLGLDGITWTGTHFVLSRLSGEEPKTRARLFAMDCRNAD